MKPLEKARQDLEKANKKRDASKKRLEVLHEKEEKDRNDEHHKVEN